MSSVNGAEHPGKAFGKLLQTKEKDRNEWRKNVVTACLD